MTGKWMRLSRISTVVLALALWGCDDTNRDLQPLVGPSVEAAYSQNSASNGFRRVKGADGVDAASAVIDSKGGKITVGRHEIFVPRRAVDAPTLFTVVVEDAEAIQVNLTAIRVSDNVDLGSRGFRVPVRLRLSYADAVEAVDPSRLVIARVNSDGTLEPRPSKVDTIDQHLTTSLDHFSRYAVGVN